MKRANMICSRGGRTGERGQTVTLVLLGLGIFLLAAIGIAVDVSNWWFHRQMAQSAADAACTAGIMDMLANSQGNTVGGFPGGSPPGDFWCSSASGAATCKYAALNGYSGSGLVTGSPSNDIQVMFPTTLPGSGLQVCGPNVQPPCIPASLANPYLAVNVFDRTPTTFTGLVRGKTTVDVVASAACVLTYSSAPIPILVLDPQNPNVKPAVSALNVQGTPVISIVGGPQRSIQVDSNDPSAAVTVGGNALVDLSLGGPNGTGSDLGSFGVAPEPSVPKNFNPGTTGNWLSSAPISDPFAQVCAPAQSTNCQPTINGYSAPAVPGIPTVPADIVALGANCATFAKIQGGNCVVPYQFHGCPESPDGCTLYYPGPYPTGITVKNALAIFDPGLYYITGGFALQTNGEVRPGTGAGDGTGGTVFYFVGGGSNTVTVTSDSGGRPASKTVDPFNTLLGAVDGTGTQYPGTTSYPNGVMCTPTSVIPSNLKGGGAGIPINGNVLLGACIGYYGDPLGTGEPAASGEQHQFLFFQDRSGTSATPNWGGGGQFLLAGTMYFHSCNASGTGVGCGAAGTYWNDQFAMNGNSASGTYVLGEIVTDNLALGGTSGIAMDLNPNVAYPILKATLIQ
jgi:hypothetical protein